MIKKILILSMFVLMTVGLYAATTPGVIHFVFDNGEVSTSEEDTFYEFRHFGLYEWNSE
ncbi:MAG: hypothetical protein U5N56_11715 [Candidatus Marinimicrobia bacterium]|nr:hypothetical protein [Candidatus Neomarinimicrobiota bacterium]